MAVLCRYFFIFIITTIISGCSKVATTEFINSPYSEAGNWYKGNTHTHTTNSDGDSPPATVARWYRDNGYDFLVLTDHNVLTDPDEVLVHGEEFLLIPGEEVSAVHRSPFTGNKPIHVNALDIDELVEPVNDQETLTKTIQANVDAIRDVEGVPHINHPNFRWAFSEPELFEVNNYKLLEIYNGHPLVNNEGNEDHPGMEALWDTMLTKGKLIYGIGVEDAHHFKEFGEDKSNPGRCWVMVQANELDKDSIMHSLEHGRFYFTTGPVIERVLAADQKYFIELDTKGHQVEFISDHGNVLASSTARTSTLKLNGTESYVCAKVYGKNGGYAWTQPVFTKAISE